MVCPFCKAQKTRVLQTVSFLDTENPRVRVCCACGMSFGTVETYDSSTKIMIHAMQTVGAIDGEKTITETASIC